MDSLSCTKLILCPNMGVTSDLQSSSSSQGIAQARLALLLLRSSVLIEFSLIEALEKIASGVFEYTWLNDEYAVDICFYYFHIQILLLHLYQTCLYIVYACGIRQFLVCGEDWKYFKTGHKCMESCTKPRNA